MSVQRGIAFTPRVAYKGRYHTICKHFFEDNNNGAIAVCNALGFPDGFVTKREQEGDINLGSIQVELFFFAQSLFVVVFNYTIS